MPHSFSLTWQTGPSWRRFSAPGSCFLAALLLHAGLVAGLWLPWRTGESETTDQVPLAAMAVELAALAAPVKAVSNQPPGPRQTATPAAAAASKPVESVPDKARQQARRPDPKPPFVPPPVAPRPLADALPMRPVEPTKVTPRPRERPAEAQPEVAAVDRTSDLPSAPEAEKDERLKAPLEGIAQEQARAAEMTWENALLTHLERHKRYPAAAIRRGQEDVVYVRLKIAPSGELMHWNIQRSAGYGALDGEVQALLRRAGSLPAPPDGKIAEVIVPIEFMLRRAYARSS